MDEASGIACAPGNNLHLCGSMTNMHSWNSRLLRPQVNSLHRQAISLLLWKYTVQVYIILQDGASIIHVKGRLLVILTAKVYAYN